jgi:hypothetical protein
MAELRLEGVSKKYPSGLVAVRNVSLTVAGGWKSRWQATPSTCSTRRPALPGRGRAPVLRSRNFLHRHQRAMAVSGPASRRR